MLYKVKLGISSDLDGGHVGTVEKYIIADDIVHAIQEAAHLCNVSVRRVWSAAEITDTVMTARPQEVTCVV